MSKEMKPIPVSAAEVIANLYGFDQVIIVARRVGGPGETSGEHVTNYGVDPEHRETARKLAGRVKFELLGWKLDEITNYGSDTEKKDE